MTIQDHAIHPGTERAVSLAPVALDALMPMHMLLDKAGIIRAIGPTLARVHADRRLIGLPLGAVFELRRPKWDALAEAVASGQPTRLSLRMRDSAALPLVGVAVPCRSFHGILVNLSFGIAVIDAVAHYQLAGSDFSPTDLTLELLYLVEANSAVMAESRKLNERLHGAKAQAEARALADTLTGLQNRRALDTTLLRLVARGIPFTLMHLDLDYFKQVNDTFGHAAGDRVLVEVARILREETRRDDLVARVGGDEFVIVFNGMTSQSQLSSIAGRLIDRIEEPIGVGGEQARISTSIGMVSSTQYRKVDIEQMMKDADQALYASKEHGRACFTFFQRDGPSV